MAEKTTWEKVKAILAAYGDAECNFTLNKQLYATDGKAVGDILVSLRVYRMSADEEATADYTVADSVGTELGCMAVLDLDDGIALYDAATDAVSAFVSTAPCTTWLECGDDKDKCEKQRIKAVVRLMRSVSSQDRKEINK